MEKIRNVIQGMVMGLAEIVPGVSGSTLALVMGIYDDFINLLHSVSEFIKTLLQRLIGRSGNSSLKKSFNDINFEFGFLLLLGMLVSIGVFSNIISNLLEEHPQYIYAVFFGLILASISIPYKEIKEKSSRIYFLIVISTIVSFFLLGLKPLEANENPSFILLFFGGVVGITGLILPGVSGSFILLMLGIYEYVVDQVKDLTKLEFDGNDVGRLAIFASGLLFGFMFFVRVVKYFYTRFPDYLLSILIGVMIGSLRVIYPFFEVLEDEERDLISPFETTSDFSQVVVVILILVGTLLILGINMLKVDRKQIQKLKVKD